MLGRYGANATSHFVAPLCPLGGKYCRLLMPRNTDANRTRNADDRDQGARRRRLLAAMAQAIEEQGYANVGVADIARHARVSKRTFYEHFADREACLVALFLDVSHRTIDAMEAALGTERSDHALHDVITVMLKRVATRPVLAESLLLDVPTVPGRAAIERRSIAERLTWLMADAAGSPARASNHTEGLTPEIAAALAGGVATLVLRELEAGHPQRIEHLADPLTAFIERALGTRGDSL